MVTQIFGDMLFTCGAECLSEFPSPESLKGRVIISTKPPKEYLETKKPDEKDNGSQKGKKSLEEKAWGAEISDLTQKLIALYEVIFIEILKKIIVLILTKTEHLDTFLFRLNYTTLQNKENGECQDEEADSHHENPNIQQNTAPEYKHLIAIQGAKSKGPTSEWLTIDPIKVKRISLNEEKLTNVALKHGKELIR